MMIRQSGFSGDAVEPLKMETNEVARPLDVVFPRMRAKSVKGLFLCVAQCLLLAIPALPGADSVAVEPGLPWYFGASLDDVARVIAKSDFVFAGVVQVDGEGAGGNSTTASGRVVFQRGLFSRGGAFPRSVPFRRDISQVGLARGESSATAPFYLWGVPMNGVQVVAFARQDDKGGGLSLLKAVPTSVKGVPELLDALKLLAAREDPSSHPKMSGESPPPSGAVLAEKVLARWREQTGSGDVKP